MRRAVLNLTPLLDLLLILLFAYQITAWVTATEVEATAHSQVTKVLADVAMLSDALDTSRSQLKLAQEALDNANTKAELIAERLTSALERHKELEQKSAAMLQLLLKIERESPSSLSAENAKKLEELMKSASETEKAVVTAISRYQKLADTFTFVEVNLREDFLVELKQGSEPPVRLYGEEEQALIAQIENSLLNLNSPRDVVVVLFRYGDVLIRRRDSIQKAVESAVRTQLPASFKDKRFYLVKEGYHRER